MPSDTFSHSASADATIDSVRSALQLPDTWKGIGPIDEVWEATHDGDDLAGFKWRARAAGKSWDGTAKRAGDGSDSDISFELDSSEITGSITVSLQTEGELIAITVTLFAQSKGFLSGMFWGVVADALRKGLPAQVEGFSNQF